MMWGSEPLLAKCAEQAGRSTLVASFASCEPRMRMFPFLPDVSKGGACCGQDICLSALGILSKGPCADIAGLVQTAVRQMRVLIGVHLRIGLRGGQVEYNRMTMSKHARECATDTAGGAGARGRPERQTARAAQGARQREKQTLRRWQGKTHQRIAR